MKHIAIAGAALIGLTAIAFAQSEPPAASAPASPPAVQESAPEAGPPEARRHMRMNGEHMRHHRREMRRGDRDRPDGAMFSWRLEDGSRFLFRCADRDTTQECVDAIMPLIERISPAARSAAD